MKITDIRSLEELRALLSDTEKTFLLIHKKGSEQSDCAYKNLSELEIDNVVVLAANVAEVRDIHTEYGITSAPSFMEFQGKKLKNTYKGCHEKAFFNNVLTGAVYSNSSTIEQSLQKQVTVYSTPTCSWCTRLKTYLDSKGVKYRDVDISKDQKAAEDLVKRSGQQGVPQTDINGKIIVGFDQPKLDSLLGL